MSEKVWGHWVRPRRCDAGVVTGRHEQSPLTQGLEEPTGLGSSARMEQWGCELPDKRCWWLSWLTPSQNHLCDVRTLLLKSKTRVSRLPQPRNGLESCVPGVTASEQEERLITLLCTQTALP